MKNILIIIVFIFGFSCTKKQEKLPDNVFYTCSMDPQVMEKKPGKCPICKMELTKITVDIKNNHAGIKLSEEQITLANIVLDKAEEGMIGEEKILNGLVVANENNKAIISSRISGRIEKLYFKNLGEVIHEGDVLYEIYSEELLTAYKEYMIASEKEKLFTDASVDYSQLKATAANRLLLWGLTNEQLQQFNAAKEARTVFPILSKTKGIITNINIKEGAYVMTGNDLFELSDFSSVWIEAQLYSSELEGFSYDDETMIRIAGMPALEIKGKISLVLPELQPQSKVDLIRIEVKNKDLLLKPGMQAYITLKSKAHKAILVKASAVLQDSKGSTLWVKEKDGSFHLKMIEKGIQSNNMIEVEKGIQIGDEVVISGAYLLNSEFIFKKGQEPTHDHSM